MSTFNIGPTAAYGFNQLWSATPKNGANYTIQLNDQKGQAICFNSNQLGANQKVLLATDNTDKVILTNAWHQIGTQTSDQGVAGMVYQDSSGGSMLVSGGAKVVGYKDGPSAVDGQVPTKQQVIDDIASIEDAPSNSTGGKDKVISQDEIQKALSDGKINAARTEFWKDIAVRFTSFDNNLGANGTAKAGDHIIGIDDIVANENIAP